MPGRSTDEDWVEFLRWALPHLQLRWLGFRKVRGQVCKRIRRRMGTLGLESLGDYRGYLERHADEWDVLDGMCRISISRFFRDRGLFEFLGATVLPELAARAVARGEAQLRAWSAGGASGEEPYSLAILWLLAMRSRYADLDLSVVATDVSPILLDRAKAAHYGASSLKELPDEWRQQAFEENHAGFQLKESYRSLVEFRLQDVRRATPEGLFDLILCRNLVFTYFDEALQKELLPVLVGRLRVGGALVIGSHERLPTSHTVLTAWSKGQRVFRKTGA